VPRPARHGLLAALLLAGRTRDATRRQRPSDASERFDATSLNFTDHRQDVRGKTVCTFLPSRCCMPSGPRRVSDYRGVCLALCHSGGREVAVSYPRALDTWFEGLVEQWDESIAPRKWVRLCAHREPGQFDLLASVIGPAEGLAELNLGEALAMFWERASFLLVEDFRDAIVLHAAAFCKDNSFILLPGQTGSGKTRLALWYRRQGFALVTDEIVAVGNSESNELVLAGALARPIILKGSGELDTLLRPAEVPLAQQDSSFGLILKLQDVAPWTPRPMERGLIVFPCFNPGTPFQLTALTPGEACLRLIENCLNARNLPRAGLPFASLLARRAKAISLVYGNTDELSGTLDVLTRQALGTRTSADDLAALCQAFTARAATKVAIAQSGTAQPIQEKRVAPASTVARFPRRLTIGMATYNDYDGVYFTVQSIRMNNPELNGALEFVVIDNDPGGPCSQALSQLGNWIDGYRYVPRGEWSGTAIRNAVFEEASSPFVLCIDSHVFIIPGALSKLIMHFETDPDSGDLLQGPLMYDDLRRIATHWNHGGARGCTECGSVIRAPLIRQRTVSTFLCTASDFSRAAARRGPASIRSFAGLAAKRDTSTKKYGSAAGERCACRFYAGFTVSIVPWDRLT
jgi:hypothetical protein